METSDADRAAVAPKGIARTDIDPYDLSNLLNPFEVQAAVRDLGPVVWLERYGVCAVARYAEVGAVMADPAHFISSAGVGLSDIRKPGAWRQSGPIVEVDPPGHTAVRLTMNRILSADVIRSWQARFGDLARTLCDEAAEKGEINAVTDLAQRFVQTGFSQALGIEFDPEALTVVGAHSANASGPKNALFEETAPLAEKIAPWFDHKQTREAMHPGGIGEKIFDAEAAGALPSSTAGPMLRTLIRGGMDTTISTLSAMMRHLADDPDWWRRARADRALIAPIFEEALRLESPSPWVYRTTAGGAQVSGQPIPDDTKVLVMLGAANRDPRRWDEPDTFRPGRSGAVHVGFGTGPHLCLGRNFSRMEVDALMNAMLDRFERLELAGAPVYRPLNALRTLGVLPLRLIPSA